jgi:hypothetical protein
MAVRWRYIGDELAQDGRGLSSVLSSGVVEGAAAVIDRQGRSCGGRWEPREGATLVGWLLAAPSPALGALLMPVLIPRPMRTQEAWCWLRLSNPGADPVDVLPTSYVDGGTGVGEPTTIPGEGSATIFVRAYVTGRQDGGAGTWARAGIGWSTLDAEGVEIEPDPTFMSSIFVDAAAGTIRCDSIAAGTEVILPGGQRVYVGAVQDDDGVDVGYCYPYPDQDAVSTESLAGLALPPLRLEAWHISLVGTGSALTVPDARAARPATAESAQAVRDATVAGFVATSQWLAGQVLSDAPVGAIPIYDSGTAVDVASTVYVGTTRVQRLEAAALALPWSDCTLTLGLEIGIDDTDRETELRGLSPRAHPLIRALAGGVGGIWSGMAAALVGPQVDSMRAYQLASVNGPVSDPEAIPEVDVTAAATPSIDAPGDPRLMALVCAVSVLEVRQ